jgi:hypothetical protein
MMLLSACGAASAEPTVGAEAIFTSAFETFSAQMATDQAAITPTTTPPPTASPSPFPTFAPLATLPSAAFTSPTPALGGAPAGCENKATWIADVTVPDGTTFTSGEDFTKTWRVQNTGTCTWNTKYTLEFKDGTKMAGTQEFVQISVPPGQQAEVSADLEAPDDIGSYYGRWELHDPDDKPFGSILTVVIKVAEPTP